MTRQPTHNSRLTTPDSLPPFPVAQWNERQVTFHPGAGPQPGAEDRAAIVFARCAEGYVLADIPERGWTVPSGRIEPGETPREAALRETWEEIGARPESLREIGRYLLTADSGETFAVPAFVGWVRAFGAIPAGSESRGARCVPPADLPACYYTWDALLERMFAYAEACLSGERE